MRTYTSKVWQPAAILLFSFVLSNCTRDKNELPIYENQGNIGPEGGIVKASDGAYIEIPSGALTSDQTITIANTTSVDVVINDGCQIYDFTPDGLTFVDSVIICMPFKDEYLGYSSDNVSHGISISVFQDSAWVKLKTTLDLEQSKAYAKTNHFSKYVITYPWRWSKYYQTNKNNPSTALVVPHYNQGDSPWCAYYSLSMISKYAGTNIKGTEFASLAGEKDYGGFLAGQNLIRKLRIDGMLDNLGLNAEIASPGWLEYDELFGYIMKMIDDGYPVLVNSYSIAHAFVVTGHNPDGFMINDPSGFVLQKIYGKDYNADIDKLSNIQISYKVLRDILDSWWKDNPSFLYGIAGLETTIVIKEPRYPPNRSVTLNFVPGYDLSKITDLDGKRVGWIDINGKYYPKGYSLFNEKGQNQTFNGTDYFEIVPYLSNSDISDVEVAVSFKIDGENISGSPVAETLKSSKTAYYLYFPKFQLKNLNSGKHLLSVELRSADSNDIFDFWDFPFEIDKEYFTSETCEDFSGTTIPSNCQVISGTWNMVTGELHGYWSWSSAQTDQAIVMLSESLYDPASYTATTDIKVRTGSEICGERFVLRSSAGNLIMITFNWNLRLVYAEYRKAGSWYSVLKNVSDFSAFNTTVGLSNEYKLVKNGSFISVFVNGVEAFSFEDTIFNGNTKLGLGAYGNAYYDSFCIK